MWVLVVSLLVALQLVAVVVLLLRFVHKLLVVLLLLPLPIVTTLWQLLNPLISFFLLAEDHRPIAEKDFPMFE
jgi:hypothetical protein